MCTGNQYMRLNEKDMNWMCMNMYGVFQFFFQKAFKQCSVNAIDYGKPVL